MVNERDTSLAARLRMLRAEYRLSQTEVASKIGISQQTYSKYENVDRDSSIDSEVIIRLCALYGVSADYLLGIEAPKQNEETKKMSFSSEEDIDFIVNRVLSELKKS